MRRRLLILAVVFGLTIVCGATWVAVTLYSHSIHGLPIYPGATDVRYGNGNRFDPLHSCSSLSMSTAADPREIQRFYLNALGGPDKGWYGDGSSYPEFNPMSTHYMRGQHMTAYVGFYKENGVPKAEIEFCEGDS